MSHIIHCPHCGIDYEVEAEDLGANANCESCGKDFILKKDIPKTKKPTIKIQSRKPPLGTPGNPMPKVDGGSYHRGGQENSSYGQPQTVQYVAAQKSRGVYIILALLLGLIGIHNFYIGRYGSGAFQLIFTVALGWTIIAPIFVFLIVLIEMFTVKTDGKGRPLD